MNSYLELAAKVLRELRSPLSARQILESAYQLSIVPRDLYGKTQHKTLHARLAEDIRNERTRSPFVRTEPGRFFLRSLLTDPGIPDRYKREYPAQPRADQLKNFAVTCLRRSDARSIRWGSLLHENTLNGVPILLRRLSEVSGDDAYLFLRTFVITERSRQVVVRRAAHGIREALGSRASLSSVGFVKGGDRTMFSEDALGLAEASLRTISEQLDIAPAEVNVLREQRCCRLIGLLAAPQGVQENSLAAITVCQCPADFDPLARYAGGGALYWHPIEARFNDVESLDPWSRELLGLGILERGIYS